MTDWSEEVPTLELLKATVTVPEVAELLGLEVNKDKITSPYSPDERTPSCHLFEDHFWCFSTGRGGDIIDLVQAFYPQMTIGHAVRKIWLRALRSGKEPGDVEKQPVREVVDFTEQLVMQYPVMPITFGPTWEARLGVRPPPACRGTTDMLLIPHRDQDGVYGVKVRRYDGSKDAWPGSQFTKRLYDPLGWPETRGDPTGCIITEGESDCWAVRAAMRPNLLHPVVPVTQPWLPVFALPAGAQSWKDAWLGDLKPFEKVYICMDNDKTGKAARDKLTSKIGYLKVEQLWVPGLYKDARAAIVAGWRPSLSA